MEQQMRLFMQFQRSSNQAFGRNEGAGGQNRMNAEKDDDLDLDEFLDHRIYFIFIFN